MGLSYSLFCDAGTIVVENGIITYVGSGADVPSAEGRCWMPRSLRNPGLIDIHVHGGAAVM